MNKSDYLARKEKESELVASALKYEEVSIELIGLDPEEFESSFDQFFKLQKQFWKNENMHMTVSDMAIELSKPKNHEILKIIDNEFVKQEKEITPNKVKWLLGGWVTREAGVKNTIKARKDIEKIKKQNMYEKFKKEVRRINSVVNEKNILGKAPDCEPEDMIAGLLKCLKEDLNDEVDLEIYSRKKIEEKIEYLETGFKDLDNIMDGGFEKGMLCTVGGRPSMGKTDLALNLFYNTFINGNKMLFVCLEGRKSKIWERLIALHSQKDPELKPLTKKQAKGKGLERLKANGEGWKYTESVNSLLKMGIDQYLIDFVGKSLNGQKGLNNVQVAIEKELLLKNDIEGIIIDHMHKLKATGRMSTNEFYGLVSGTLKNDIAVKHNIPIIALAQLNRNVTHRQNKRPALSDLRGSGTIEEDIDYGFFLYREDYQSGRKTEKEKKDMNSNSLEIIIGKNRGGRLGKVVLYYEKSTGKIELGYAEEEFESQVETNPAFAKERKERRKKHLKKIGKKEIEKVKGQKNKDKVLEEKKKEMQELCKNEEEVKYIDNLFRTEFTA